MEDNYIKPIGETLQDKINWLEKELFKEKEKNEKYWKQNIEYQNTLEKLQKNTVPISLIEKKIEELREKVDGDDYWKYTEKDYLGMQYQIEVLQELLNERSNTDE